MRSLTARRLAAACVMLVAISCSDSTEPQPAPAKTYPHDTPGALVESFVSSYEDRNITEYSKLFTADFTFEFSNAADPLLVQKYSTGWLRSDEIAAATTLFRGGTNSDGIYQEAAEKILLSLPDSIPGPDTTRADSAYAYRVVFSPGDSLRGEPGGHYVRHG